MSERQKIEEIVRSTVASVGNDLGRARDRLKSRGFTGAIVDPYLSRIKDEWAREALAKIGQQLSTTEFKEAFVAPVKTEKTKEKTMNKQAKKTTPAAKPKLRVASARAGTGKKCDLNYFPPEGSVSYQTLVNISEAGKEGMPAADYPLSEMFLGRLIRCGLVASDGETLTATQRTRDVLSGKLELPSTRGSEFNRIVAAMKTETDPEAFEELVQKLAAIKDQKIEQNVARQEAKDEEKQSA